MRLDGKTALITGAGSGMGRAASVMFAEAGAAIVCADLVAAAAEESAELVREPAGRAVAAVTDVRSARTSPTR